MQGFGTRTKITKIRKHFRNLVSKSCHDSMMAKFVQNTASGCSVVSIHVCSVLFSDKPEITFQTSFYSLGDFQEMCLVFICTKLSKPRLIVFSLLCGAKRWKAKWPSVTRCCFCLLALRTVSTCAAKPKWHCQSRSVLTWLCKGEQQQGRRIAHAFPNSPFAQERVSCVCVCVCVSEKTHEEEGAERAQCCFNIHMPAHEHQTNEHSIYPLWAALILLFTSVRPLV